MIKNAIVYEKLGDFRPFRDDDALISMFKELKADTVFRCDWRWNPFPETGEGYTYEKLRITIQKIQEAIPGIDLISGLSLQKIAYEERNEITQEIIDQTKTWAMALDPSAYDPAWPTKEVFQSDNPWYTNDGYFPDVNNPEFQELFLSFCKNRIDMGLASLWLDLLFHQATYFYQLVGDFYHPAVVQAYDSSVQIVQKIKEYGSSKGKNIRVGSWSAAMGYPYTSKPALDFITATVSATEISNMQIGVPKWTQMKTDIIQAFGNVPIIIFTDWGYVGSPMEAYIQLSGENRIAFPEMAKNAFDSLGMIYSPPIHNGHGLGWYDMKEDDPEVYKKVLSLNGSSASLGTGFALIFAGLAGYYLLKKKGEVK